MSLLKLEKWAADRLRSARDRAALTTVLGRAECAHAKTAGVGPTGPPSKMRRAWRCAGPGLARAAPRHPAKHRRDGARKPSPRETRTLRGGHTTCPAMRHAVPVRSAKPN